MTFTPASGLPLADTSDMPSVHRVFRNALSAAPDLVASATGPDRIELVGTHLDNVLRLLHVHHDGEDELLTPKLLERAPDQAPVVTAVAAQHQEVVAPLVTLETALAAWTATPDPAAADALVAAASHLESVLVPHLDEEESVVLPIASSCIDVAEWGQLPSHGMSHFTGDKIWLILGLIREQMSPAKLAEMDAHMPPPVKDFWTTAGQGLFDAHMAALAG